MYIKHFLKSTSFFKFLFFIVFLSENLAKKPPHRKAYHRFTFLYVVHLLEHVFGCFFKNFCFDGKFYLKKACSCPKNTNVANVVRRGREARGRKQRTFGERGKGCAEGCEGNFRGGCKGVTKGGKGSKRAFLRKKEGARHLQKEAKGSLKTCPKPAPFPNNAESMPEKLHVFCYFPLYLYYYTCQSHARGSKIKKNMPQIFYTHLKSVIFKEIDETKCGMPETRTVPEQRRNHARKTSCFLLFPIIFILLYMSKPCPRPENQKKHAAKFLYAPEIRDF